VAGPGKIHVFEFSNNSWSHQAELSSQIPNVNLFEPRVALHDDLLIASTPDDGSSGRGLNPIPDNLSARRSGAALIFMREGSAWTNEAVLKAPNADAGDFFGDVVEANGPYVVVSSTFEDGATGGVNTPGAETDNFAENAGAVYVFRVTP